MNHLTLAASFIRSRFFVSTVIGPRHYETKVWAWDNETQKCGERVMVETDDDATSDQESAMVHHAAVCSILAARVEAIEPLGLESSR